MTEVKNQVGMLFVGLINVLSCYIAGIIIWKFGKELNVASSIPWCLLQISYGTMPFFGLWDNLVRISEYNNRDMNGFSSFFSVMTLMFLASATIIDSKLVNITWNLKHILVYLLIIIPFWLILFLVPQLDSIAYAIYPICMLPIALPCTILIIYYLRKLNILCGYAGFILFLSLLFSVLGFMSLVIWDRENPARMYGWYIFCWLSVILLFVLWCFVHIYKKLDNDNGDKLGNEQYVENKDDDEEQVGVDL